MQLPPKTGAYKARAPQSLQEYYGDSRFEPSELRTSLNLGRGGNWSPYQRLKSVWILLPILDLLPTI